MRSPRNAGPEERSSRDEVDVTAGLRQQCSEEHADTTGTVDQDSHGTNSVGGSVPCKYRSRSSGR
jgi:hypothetical protein